MSRRHLAAIVAALLVLAWAAPAGAWQAAPAQRTASQAQTPAKKAKKVWTNDDLEALRPGGTTSSETLTVPPTSEGTAAAGESADKADASSKGKPEDPVEQLRKRLAPLRADVDSVEAQLRSLRSARTSGNTTGGGLDINKSPGGLNTENQVSQLEQRRSDLLRQIATIEDEARRKGIAPGAIR